MKKRMHWKKHYKTSFIVALGCLVFVSALIRYQLWREDSEQTSREKWMVEPETMTAVLSGISAVWRQGVRLVPSQVAPGLLKQCFPDEQLRNSVGSDFYRCNPWFLNCYVNWQKKQERNLKKINHKKHTVFQSLGDSVEIDQKITLHFAGQNQDGNFSMGIGYKVIVWIEDNPVHIFLSDDCKTSYLPEGIYQYGDRQYLWDNVGRTLYLDKYPVAQYQLKWWIQAQGDKGETRPLSFNLNDHPFDSENIKIATAQSSKNMQRFCQSQGKKLMEAHIFDAASFFNKVSRTHFASSYSQGWYPWTRSKKDKYLNPQRSGIDDPVQSLSLQEIESLCRTLFIKECESLGITRQYFSSLTPSWIGINEVLGGDQEFHLNNIEPHKNLKKSSRYFNRKSSWHRIGVRGTKQEFNQEMVGFRCYKEVYGEW